MFVFDCVQPVLLVGVLCALVGGGLQFLIAATVTLGT